MAKKIVAILFIFISAAYAFHIKKEPVSNHKKAINILFVGNSYTTFNDMPSIVTKISDTLNSEYIIKTDKIAFGGATLERHWNKQSALNAIKKGKWDFIVLQGQSTSMLWRGGISSFDKYLEKFATEINKTDTKIILFSTWPRQKNNSYYKKSGLTYLEALTAIQGLYYHFANKYKTGIVYTGTPFFDANAMSINTYSNDGSHPNLIGSYIVALAFTKYIFPNAVIDCDKIIKKIKIDNQTCIKINEIM